MSGSDLPPIPPSSRARRAREAEKRRSSRAVLSASDIAGIVVLGVVGLAVAAILGVVIAGNLFQRDPPSAGAGASSSPTASRSARPTTTARASTRPTADADTPWAGPIRAAPIASAHASCGQHGLRTTTGQIAQFQGPEAIDGQARTAWRCAGDGVGRTLRVKLVAPGRIAAIGLVPGFAATDPITGKDGFTTDRRVLSVRWSLGGRIVDQTLIPTREKLQLLRIPPTLAGSITLTILVTAPAEEDVFAVSDIGVYAVRT